MCEQVVVISDIPLLTGACCPTVKWRISPAVYESVKELTDVGVEHASAQVPLKFVRNRLQWAIQRSAR